MREQLEEDYNSFIKDFKPMITGFVQGEIIKMKEITEKINKMQKNHDLITADNLYADNVSKRNVVGIIVDRLKELNTELKDHQNNIEDFRAIITNFDKLVSKINKYKSPEKKIAKLASGIEKLINKDSSMVFEGVTGVLTQCKEVLNDLGKQKVKNFDDYVNDKFKRLKKIVSTINDASIRRNFDIAIQGSDFTKTVEGESFLTESHAKINSLIKLLSKDSEIIYLLNIIDPKIKKIIRKELTEMQKVVKAVEKTGEYNSKYITIDGSDVRSKIQDEIAEEENWKAFEESEGPKPKSRAERFAESRIGKAFKSLKEWWDKQRQTRVAKKIAKEEQPVTQRKMGEVRRVNTEHTLDDYILEQRDKVFDKLDKITDETGFIVQSVIKRRLEDSGDDSLTKLKALIDTLDPRMKKDPETGINKPINPNSSMNMLINEDESTQPAFNELVFLRQDMINVYKAVQETGFFYNPNDKSLVKDDKRYLELQQPEPQVEPRKPSPKERFQNIMKKMDVLNIRSIGKKKKTMTTQQKTRDQKDHRLEDTIRRNTPQDKPTEGKPHGPARPGK